MFGQTPADTPGYNPLIAKLLSLQHKANSNTIKNQKPSLEKLQMNQIDESVNIYIKYEMDTEIAMDPDKVKFPPKKVMNLDIVYSYRYLIPYSSVNELVKLLPVIELRNGQKFEDVKASNYYISKGKVKRNKIKRNEIIIDSTSPQLSFLIENGILKNDAFLEIEIQVKTPYFNALVPYFDTTESFNRTLTVSIPSILRYQLPANSSTFELQSEETNSLFLLQLSRENYDWDNIAKVYGTDCITYTYKVDAPKSQLTNIAFELEKIALPFGVDIGVPLSEIYLNNE